jgi:hypothetical protein
LAIRTTIRGPNSDVTRPFWQPAHFGNQPIGKAGLEILFERPAALSSLLRKALVNGRRRLPIYAPVRACSRPIMFQGLALRQSSSYLLQLPIPCSPNSLWRRLAATTPRSSEAAITAIVAIVTMRVVHGAVHIVSRFE